MPNNKHLIPQGAIDSCVKGMSYAEASRNYGCSKFALRSRCIAIGVSKDRRVVAPKGAFLMYSQGHSVTDCAIAYGMDVTTLWRRLKEAGFCIRTQDEVKTRTREQMQEHIKSSIAIDSNGCWLWQLANDGAAGYGSSCYQGKPQSIHRISYTVFNGPITNALLVRHTCDVPACCNPDHLILGTAKDNSQDAIDRDRRAIGSRIGISKLTENDVSKIKELLRSGTKQVLIAKEYGVSKNTISAINTNKSWSQI